MIDDEEMAGAEGNKHGYNRHEERTQPYKEFQWQAPPKISGFLRELRMERNIMSPVTEKQSPMSEAMANASNAGWPSSGGLPS